ncbi:MAG: Isochorismatase [Rhodocyclales bacterium]|nr:Isochorismatase [Rhodocyclales bacterium]
MSNPPSSQTNAATSFGEAHNAWTSTSADRVSLVRQMPPPRALQIAAQPAQLEIDIARSVLIVVDMQNDFCHAAGWFGQKGIDTSAARRPIPVIADLLPAWRAAGGRVLWLNWGVRADLANLPPTIRYKAKGGRAEGIGYGEASPDDRGPTLVRGSWGAARIDELQAAPDDLHVDKHRLSGFWDSELDGVLRNLGMTTLLFAGINTDRCVFSTLQDAGFLGYDCVLIGDACATSSPEYVTQAIHFLVLKLHGFITDSAALHTGLQSLSAPLSSVSSPP